jgi:hypothetical protein
LKKQEISSPAEAAGLKTQSNNIKSCFRSVIGLVFMNMHRDKKVVGVFVRFSLRRFSRTNDFCFSIIIGIIFRS